MTHAGLVWGILTGGPIGYLILVFLVINSVILMTFLFQAACSLANVEPPNFFFSVLLVLVALLVTLPPVGGLVYLLTMSGVQKYLGQAAVAVFLLLVGSLIAILIGAVLYFLTLRTSLFKGFLTGLFEQLLALLAFSLLYGVLSVILGLIQGLYGPLTDQAVRIGLLSFSLLYLILTLVLGLLSIVFATPAEKPIQKAGV